MAFLAQAGGDKFSGARNMAEVVGAPPNYLGKLLQSMSHAGLVESRKGSGGGFRLARPANEISLHDIVNAVEPNGRWDECILGNPTCSDATACPVHERWKPLRAEYTRFLAETTLADFEPNFDDEPPDRRAPDD